MEFSLFQGCASWRRLVVFRLASDSLDQYWSFKHQLALTYLLMTLCPPITLFSPASSSWIDR